MWNWLSQTLAPEELTRYALAVKTAVLGYHAEEASAHATGFWKTASAALTTALDTEAKRKSARSVLGGDLVVADASEIAILLAAGVELCEVQARLPKPLPVLTDDYLWQLREIYDRLAAEKPDSAAYIAVVTMNRLEKPWEALKLPMMISRKTQDTLISSTDMGLVGELIFGAIERHGTAIRAAKPQQAFDADALVVHLTKFATLSGGIVKEMEIRRDGKWGQRLLKDRAAVAEVMESFMTRSPREVLAALPTHKTGTYAGGPRAPDLSRAPDPERRCGHCRMRASSPAAARSRPPPPSAHRKRMRATRSASRSRATATTSCASCARPKATSAPTPNSISRWPSNWSRSSSAPKKPNSPAARTGRARADGGCRGVGTALWSA